MCKLIIKIIVLLSLLFSAEKPYVLMVSFDGLRFDYTDWVETPNFDYLEKNGVKADGLISVFPSLTFPNHYSIATGSYAGKHNITGNHFFDKTLDKKYSLYDRKAVENPNFYKSEPIWVTAEKQGVKSASYFWVGTEAPIKGIHPSIYKKYDGSVPFKARVDSVITWFNLKPSIRPQLVMLYFSEPDYTGHKYGVNKDKINLSLKEMDRLLGYLHSQLKELDIYDQLNIIITSDHGMVDVSIDRTIVIDDYISQTNHLNIEGSGSHIQISLTEKYKYKTLLHSEIQNIPNSQVWGKDKIPDRFHFVNSNTGDYLILANEGWFITTKADINDKKSMPLGMHGYDPELESMHGIFYAMGKQIKKDVKINAFENIHIYPLVCRLLDIEEYNGEFDSPDGNINILLSIIK